MSKTHEMIDDAIKIAKQINESKFLAIEELRGMMNACPIEYLPSTKEFIERLLDNIESRNKCIYQLKELDTGKDIDEKFFRVWALIKELELLDQSDCKLCDEYEEYMKEE